MCIKKDLVEARLNLILFLLLFIVNICFKNKSTQV